MRKQCLLSILFFCVYAIAYGQTDNSTFTLTDIPSRYNGKYVYLEGEDPELVGIIYYNEKTDELALARVSNGRVSIPMWIWDDYYESLSKYTGNDIVDYLEIYFFNSDDLFGEVIVSIYFEDLVLKNGSATKSWYDGEVWDWDEVWDW